MPEVPEEVKRGRKLVEQTKNGPWPSYIKESEKTRYPLDLYAAALDLKRVLWTTGGYVSVPGVPTGILMRVTSRPDIGENANVVRVLLPSGNFVTSDMLEKYADFADKYGVGMLHALTCSHNMEIPGIPKERVRDFATEFKAAGFEVGSTGDAFRNTTVCVGPALCEYAGVDTLGARDRFYDRFNDYAKYPTFPHKIKLKISGCPLDCARASQKACIGFIGTWEGGPDMDESRVRALGPATLDAITHACPTGAIERQDGGVTVKGEDCIQCMKCVRMSQGAFSPGKHRQIQIVVGGKLRGKKGPLISKSLCRVDTEQEAFDILDRIVNVFQEHSARKERLGDTLFRIGMKGFLDLMGMKPDAAMVKDLRTNIFYGVTDEEKEKQPREIKTAVGGG